MKNVIFISLFSLLSINIFSQEQINESMEFQSDPSKDYSIVIPSSYEDGEPTAAFLALHPFNTSRWNGQTWCEELAGFAEANNVILICPDGGADGKIDDPIDTSFTSFLLDSAFMWYDIDPEKLYATGFSWGGKTTYTYGLNHIDKFAGLMPIGAAVSTSEVNNIQQNAVGVPIYIVHGSLDSPNSRFYPLINAMESNGACVESNLLLGVGHTIDFANQIEILSEAYTYLQDNACTTTSTIEIKDHHSILKYNALENGQTINLNLEQGNNWVIYTTSGKKVLEGIETRIVVDLTPAHYIIRSGQYSQLFRVL